MVFDQTDQPKQTPCEQEHKERRSERVDQLIGAFLRRRFRISLREIYSTMRAILLTDVEHVPCNLCGSDMPVIIANTDKYGLGVTTVMCRKCGLMYLDPRPTAASYDRFYTEGSREEGVYHVSLSLNNVEGLLKRHHGSDFTMSDDDRDALNAFARTTYAELLASSPDALRDGEVIDALEAKAREQEAWEYEAYAEHIFTYLKSWVPQGGKVFEAGASWGKLLEPWRDLHGCEVTGLEPREAAVQAAMDRLGIKLFQGFPATASVPENTYDVVLNIRTINHMIDPLADLRHAWRWLKPGGILFIDISDAIREAHYEGFETNVVEIDHTYMFSICTLCALVEQAGFKVEHKEIVDTRHVLHGEARAPEMKQIRLIARKSEQKIDITWPDPMQELASLLQGELDRERNLIEAVKSARRGLTKTKQKSKRERDTARAAAESKTSITARWLGLRGGVSKKRPVQRG